MQEVYQKITAILNSISDELPDAYDAEWTQWIKTQLAELGQDRDHIVYTSGTEVPGVRKEWVYDLAWVLDARSETGENIATRRIVLACECEWATNWPDVWDDFDKLLQARADYRVFITHEFDGQSVDEITDKLIARVDSYEQTSPGDSYLLAVYQKESRSFAPTLLEIIAPDNVRASRLMI